LAAENAENAGELQNTQPQPDTAMKLPDFEITPAIEALALEIVGLLKGLPALDTDAKFLHLRKNNRIKAIQSSLAIEANSLSVQQVADIINGKKVIGDAREIQEVKNAWAAYEEIGQYDPFSLDSLLQAHTLMSNRLVKDSGVFRTMQVNVYKGYELIHEGAKPQEIQPLMRRLFDWAKNSNVNAVIKSCILHFAIEYVHPFEDGNGRMGRLWQTVVLHSWDRNFQWIPVETMVYQNQQGYYSALNLAGKQNNTNIFIEFMLGVLKFTLGNIIESRKAKTAAKDGENATVNEWANGGGVSVNVSVNVSVKDRILEIVGQLPGITVKKLAEILSLNERTIYRNLKELKFEKKIARVGADKNGHWEILQPPPPAKP
jgi:Fic family protein